jgi:serine/threonine-protein kinase
MGDAEVGETVAGYVLEAPLGRGSTSQVFAGRHQAIGRRAAIKVLALSAMTSPDARRRLLQEARAVADVHHPHIAAIWDFHESEHPPRVALVMELVEGPTLEVLRGAPLEPRRARDVAGQLVSAIRAAHAAGVVHRDLKPANLLFTQDPRPARARPHLVVVDFGLAKRLGAEGMVKTAAGAMLGTPAYMAPEQVAGRPAPSPATDVYAVGALVYELFTGERAFAQESAEALLDAKMRGGVPELPLPPPIERQLQDVLRRCLEREPSRRPSLGEVAAALEGLGERALSIPAGATALAPAPARPRPERPSPPWAPRAVGRARRERDLATGAVSADEVREAVRAAEGAAAERAEELDEPTKELSPAIGAAVQAALSEPDDEGEGVMTELAGAPLGASVADPKPTPPPPADSVLRPLDVRRAISAPEARRARVRVPTEEPADGEAETVPPAQEASPGRPRPLALALAVGGAALLAGVAATLWILS